MIAAQYFILLKHHLCYENKWLSSLGLLLAGSWNPQCSGWGSVHANSLLLLLLDVGPQRRPSGSGCTHICLYLWPRRPHMARGCLGALYCDKVRPRLLTPVAQEPASPGGLLQSSPGGCRMPAGTRVGRTSWGWGNCEVGAATGPPAHFSQMQRSDFPLLGYRNMGGHGRDRNWGKAILSPAAKLLSFSKSSKRSVNRSWFFLKWRAHLCYHLFLFFLNLKYSWSTVNIALISGAQRVIWLYILSLKIIFHYWLL